MTFEYGYEVSGLDNGLLAISGTVLFFYLLLLLVIIVSMWKIFEKAGKPGWATIVPIYNLIVMLQIANLPLWLIILLIIPIVNIFAGIVISVLVALNIAKAFGKDTVFGVLMIFFPYVMYPILAFSDATYTLPESTINL